MPIAIEQHVDWITNCIREMRPKGLKRIQATVNSAVGQGRQRSRGRHAAADGELIVVPRRQRPRKTARLQALLRRVRALCVHLQ